MEGPTVWLIAGPTASGKSALALNLARRIGGEVVNADSMQVYADLRVLTARPTPEDEVRAPHHLYGFADGPDAWSVGRWLRAVRPVLDGLSARGRSAVVVGGTGLYLRALTHGLAEAPAVAPEVRAEAAARFERWGEARFRLQLRAHDPEAEARIAPGDRQRLTRAYEVWLSSGRALTAWRAETTAPIIGAWRGVVVERPRPELYARIDARFDAMLRSGALAEVEALCARGISFDRPVMKALGVRELKFHLCGRLSLDEAAAQARRETRRFAKRQTTWFRNQAPDWPRIAGSDIEAALAAAARQPSVKQSL